MFVGTRGELQGEWPAKLYLAGHSWEALPRWPLGSLAGVHIPNAAPNEAQPSLLLSALAHETALI
jgi:hypothetical protein